MKGSLFGLLTLAAVAAGAAVATYLISKKKDECCCEEDVDAILQENDVDLVEEGAGVEPTWGQAASAPSGEVQDYADPIDDGLAVEQPSQEAPTEEL